MVSSRAAVTLAMSGAQPVMGGVRGQRRAAPDVGAVAAVLAVHNSGVFHVVGSSLNTRTLPGV